MMGRNEPQPLTTAELSSLYNFLVRLHRDIDQLRTGCTVHNNEYARWQERLAPFAEYYYVSSRVPHGSR